MSEKYIKIQSQQNGEFSSTNNRVDFIIPASMGKISLRDSWVNVYAIPEYTGNGVPEVIISWSPDGTQGNATNNYFNNVAIVKNAHISSSNKGMIESVRRTDVLRNMLHNFRSSYTTIRSESYMAANQLKSLTNERHMSAFNDTNNYGATASSINQHTPIMVRLEDILDFCGADIVDCQALGDTKVHLELNLNKLVAKEVSNTLITGSAAVEDVANPAADTDISSLTLSGDFNGVEDCPYWVGQRLKVTGNINGAAGTEHEFTVSNIDRNLASGQIVLSSAATIFTVTNGNGGATGMTLTVVAAGATSLKFPLCEVVVKQLDPATEAPDTLLYNQYDTFELNGNNLGSYTNTVEVNGAATNALICPIAAANGLQVSLDSLESYRLACNNIELSISIGFTFLVT